MPLDPRIPLGAQSPQIDFANFSNTNALSSAMKIRGMDQENQLNAQSLGEQNNLRSFLAGNPDLENAAVKRRLASNFGDSGREIVSSLTGIDTAQTTEATRRQALAVSTTAQYQNLLSGVNTRDQAIGWAVSQKNDPALADTPIGKASLEQILNGIPTDEAGFTQWKDQTAMGMAKWSEQNKPNFTSQNVGNATQIMSTPGRGGPATVVSGSRQTIKPSDAENQRLAIQRAQLGVSQQNADSASLSATNQPITAIEIEDPNNPGTFNVVDGRTGRVLGRAQLTAAQAKTLAETNDRNTKLDSAISSVKSILEPGGLLDVSTGSGFGAATDASARVFGISTEGNVAIAQLQPIADMVLKLVPRFEGPQSDKDVETYNNAAGKLADPSIPNTIRKSAAQTILKLMEKSRNQATPSGAPSGNQAAPSGAPQSAVDYLRRNPNMSSAFDAKYGPGSAKKALGN